MPELRAIVFDLDDTLYPERAFVFSGFRAVAYWAQEHLGIPVSQGLAALIKFFDEGVRGDIFNRWLESSGFKASDWVPQMVRVYREHCPHIAPYPEVPGLLQRFRRYYRLGLLTDGYVEVQKKKLAALRLEDYFDVIVFSDEWGREAWKPSPLPFKIALEQLGVQAPEAIYVADNPLKDFWGARQVGMWTARIRRPDGLYNHLEAPSSGYAPHFEIVTLGELESILGGLIL